jgi:hypothetical protein
MIFSFARGIVSRKVCIGVLPKHRRHLIRRATLHSFRAEAHQTWDDATVAA